MGSGTTIFAANKMKRNAIGIEIVPEYYDMVNSNCKKKESYLLEKGVEYASVANQ